VISDGFMKKRCSDDIQHYNWSQKICGGSFDPFVDVYGESVDLDPDSPSLSQVKAMETTLVINIRVIHDDYFVSASAT
jgi:hypothetical protein